MSFSMKRIKALAITSLCLKEMRSRVSELGVRAGEWRPIKSQAQRSVQK